MAFTGTVSYEGDGELPQVVHDEAVQCAEQVRAQRGALGAPRLIKAFDLADGSQAYVLDMENTWRVHIIPPFQPLAVGLSMPDQLSTPEIPVDPIVTIAGLLSGGMQITTLDYHAEDEDAGRPWSGYYIKDDAVSLMPESSALFTHPEAAFKLGVLENPIFAPFDRILSEHIYSQFATTEPGNYTGAMCSIVQLLLGVGKVLESDYEQRWIEADPENRFPLVLIDPDREEHDIPDVPTSFYSGEGTPEIQISYDRHWNRTHGVMWGRDNTGKRIPMLVELGQRGIHAMPFPVDELSKLPEVQAHYHRVYPDLERFTPFWNESAGLFEAFGGFPTGDRMAGVKEDFDRQVRAGWVIEADRNLSAFYAGMPMCTGFGWAFNGENPTAINTMYTYNGLGQKVGYCYEVRLVITENAESQQVRNTVTERLISALGLTDPVDRYKAERIDQDTAESFLENPDYDIFDDYVVDPDWRVHAEIALVKEGIIDYPALQCPNFNPCDIIGSPHFKYFEPLLGVVLNFDFAKGDSSIPNPWISDGPIFATYVNGSAEILSYFYDYTPVSSAQISWDTRQVCQFTGGWETGHLTEGSRPRGYFYTSSHDYREDVSFASGSRTTINAAIHGNYDFMSFCAFFAMDSVITKHWIGSQTHETESWSSKSFNVSVTCASNNRSMFFACREETVTDRGKSRGYSGGQYIGNSGAVRYGSLYNFDFHWSGVCRGPNHPTLGNPVGVMVNSEPFIIDPNACLGVDPPGAVLYYAYCIREGEINACGESVSKKAANDWICGHPLPDPEHEGCVIIQSAVVTRKPTIPPGWSASDPTTRYWQYEIRAFGHPLMHNRVIQEYEEETSDNQAWIQYVSDPHWWRCSLTNCRAPPWSVTVNYYGPAYVGTNKEFGFGWVEFGHKPSVGGKYFGVVY